MAQPEPGSPRWVLDRLLTRLQLERPVLQAYDDWYWGRHPLPHVPPGLDERYVAQFQDLLRQSKANFMEMVVDAKANRIRFTGIRMSASTDDNADPWLTEVIDRNELLAMHRLGVRDTLTMGRGVISVWAGEQEGIPSVVIEDPRQVVVEMEPGSARKRRAALKVWVDEWTGLERANVYLPDGIYKYQRSAPAVEAPRAGIVPIAQPIAAVVSPTDKEPPDEWKQLGGGDGFVKNPYGVVTMVPTLARPDGRGNGHSIIEGAVPIQERLNGGLFNRSLAAWFAAFRQKWATGVEIPEDEQGNKVEPYKAAVHRMFIDEDPNAKFGTFDATDITQYLKAHEQDVKDIASITFTPRHFLIQQGQEPSGDAIASAEAPLVASIRDIEDFLDSGYNEVTRLICQVGGKTVPKDPKVLWADPRDPSVIEAARTDAIIKQRAEGLISLSMAQEKLGYSPEEIQRMADDLRSEALAAAGVELARQALGNVDGGSDADRQPAAG